MTTTYHRLGAIAATALLVSCVTGGNNATLSELRSVKVEIKEEKVQGGIEKAMEGYQRFLAQSKDSALSAEATRRLADLKIEREYGVVGAQAVPAPSTAATKTNSTSAAITAPE